MRKILCSLQIDGGLGDLLEDTMKIIVNIDIVGADDGPTARFQETSPALIVSQYFSGAVSFSVDLDDQLDRRTCEIRNKRSDWMLTPEAQSEKLIAA
jgi:hypothetical protein